MLVSGTSKREIIYIGGKQQLSIWEKEVTRVFRYLLATQVADNFL